MHLATFPDAGFGGHGEARGCVIEGPGHVRVVRVHVVQHITEGDQSVGTAALHGDRERPGHDDHLAPHECLKGRFFAELWDRVTN
eukprot:CAMPEP_0185758396 /NCGR_PEP_ID=MMETSP1174-20130828/17051_1 /TAXON_ID=35687 /ORGANISM="Dictyocha speculum, Strain CCMP1381" /LENGTH=84 /DNA_ID=CAMNT_0028438227 /DNA_START=499 /DNA_END=750 /DNA_ORIENTATION=-